MRDNAYAVVFQIYVQARSTSRDARSAAYVCLKHAFRNSLITRIRRIHVRFFFRFPRGFHSPTVLEPRPFSKHTRMRVLHRSEHAWPLFWHVDRAVRNARTRVCTRTSGSTRPRTRRRPRRSTTIRPRRRCRDVNRNVLFRVCFARPSSYGC